MTDHGGTDMLRVNEGVGIPMREISFTFSRSGGPGGQNVNKVSTRATLAFDVSASTALTEEQAARILDRLAPRIGRDGVLRVVAQTHRTQGANKTAALERFGRLLQDALTDPLERKDTAMPPAARRRRLEDKRRHGRLKRERSRGWHDD